MVDIVDTVDIFDIVDYIDIFDIDTRLVEIFSSIFSKDIWSHLFVVVSKYLRIRKYCSLFIYLNFDI